MKLLIVLFLSCLAVSKAEDEIDWTRVKPISHFPEYWTIRGLIPPKEIHESHSDPEISGRIVNGQVAQQGQFPYQVALISRFSQGDGLCGGSIISRRSILTAAHCLRMNELTQFTWVIKGAHNLRNSAEPTQVRAQVANTWYRIHPGWTPQLIRNDIALVILPPENAITFNEFVQPAVLPLNLREELFVDAFGTVSGWGVYSDDGGRTADELRYVSARILANSRCSLLFPGVIRDENICMSGLDRKGACSGDSGGPLTVQRGGKSMQVGVVSFGLALGCERIWPSVFARVTTFLPFIEANLVE